MSCHHLVSLYSDVPVFMTKPHFLDCPAYLKYVDGLKPVRKIHDTLLHVEPVMSFKQSEIR